MKTLRLVFLILGGFGSLHAFSQEAQRNSWSSVSCEKEAGRLFEKEWGNGMVPGKESATLATYKSHFNESLGRCFMLVHVKTTDIKKKTKTAISIFLNDVSDKTEYASYFEENEPHSKKPNRMTTCIVAGKECASEPEFESMVKPYMQD